MSCSGIACWPIMGGNSVWFKCHSGLDWTKGKRRIGISDINLFSFFYCIFFYWITFYIFFYKMYLCIIVLFILFYIYKSFIFYKNHSALDGSHFVIGVCCNLTAEKHKNPKHMQWDSIPTKLTVVKEVSTVVNINPKRMITTSFL